MSSTQLAYERRRPCRPLVAGSGPAHQALRFFEQTPKSEAAFYIRFQTLPAAKLELLKAFYGVTAPWAVFTRICKYWNVRAN